MFRIASFNVNSIRSRLEIALGWMKANECDALCVQETKVTDADFPIGAISDAGYQCAFVGQKSYNGVAIISPHDLQDVTVGTGNPELDIEARLIRAKAGGINIVNTYIPQGTAVGTLRFQYKLDFLRSMRDYFSRDFTPDDLVVWVGDFNVARESIDVYDPEGLQGSVCFNPAEWEALDYVMDWGLVDVFRKHHPSEPNQYTFWDYRVPNGFKRRMGWRLDYIMATKPLADKSIDCRIDAEPRMLEKPSDHTIITADFSTD